MRAFLSILAIFLLGSPANASDALTRADAAWARRAEGHSGAQAAAGPIEDAVTALEEALTEEPTNLAIRVRLLRALWFKGDHVPLDDESRLAVFEHARNLAQDGIDSLLSNLPDAGKKSSPEKIADHLRDTDHAAQTYFWGAAHWGLWGRHRGKIASARQGVAGKIRDYCQVAIALDETAENAGGRRILGRLHTEAPKLPFITGWIDRDEAVQQLERAVELAPDDLLSRLYYLEALIEFEPTRRTQAIDELRTFVETEPNPATIVEDLKILGDARELLGRAER